MIERLRKHETIVLAVLAFVAGGFAGYLLWGRPPPRGLAVELSDDATFLVQRVIDGDTIVLSNGLHVRYIGIDTPEQGRYTEQPQPYAEEATRRNRELVQGKRVRLRFERERVDRYGRILAHVYPVESDAADAVPVEEVLVREGLAKAVRIGDNGEMYARLKTAELAARQEKRGQWSRAAAAPRTPSPAPPREDPSHAPLVALVSGGRIHLPDCLHAARAKPGQLGGYRDLADARASGRAFCKVCRPEEKLEE